MKSSIVLLLASLLATTLLTSCGSTTSAPAAQPQATKPYNPYSQMSGSYLRGPRGGRR